MGEKPVEEGQGLTITGFSYEACNQKRLRVSKAVPVFQALERSDHCEAEIWPSLVPIGVSKFMELCHQGTFSMNRLAWPLR